MRTLLASIVVAFSANVLAGELSLVYPADLPPLSQAQAAIRQAPQVRAAQATIAAEAAQRDSLEAGPHEWAVRIEGGKRQLVAAQGSPAQRYGEWRAALERPFRLPGKVAIDAEMGAQGVAQARAALGDALHETSRALLKDWFAWLREREAERLWQLQRDLLARQEQATRRRVELGDASRLEVMQSEAASAQAQAEHERVSLRATIAAGELKARFPLIELPAQVTPSVPQPLAGSLDEWRGSLREHNHEILLVRAQTQRARLAASRADAERLPDPTLGVHVGSERSSEERLAGLSLTIPLPGEARAANARRETALATAAAQKEALVLARIDAEIATAYASAQASYRSWQLADDAAQRVEQVAALTARARTLGEASLGDVLLAARLANEVRLAASNARLEALEARYRLYLDSHRLWPIADAWGDE